MRRQGLDLLRLVERRDHAVGLLEGILELGKPLDQARAALEELAQLVDGQLPR